MINLIINADDFGLVSGINRGILDSLKAGIITSTSVMVTGRAFKEGAVLLKELNADIGIGLHFTLDSEKPVSDTEDISSLVDNNGFFFERRTFLRNLFLGGISYEEIRNEFKSQFELALESGLLITHIDGHGHIHMYPRIYDIIVKTAAEYGIYKIRKSYEPCYFWMGSGFKNIAKCMGLSICNLLIIAFKKDKTIKMPDMLIGLSHSGHLTIPIVENYFKRLKKGAVYELMVHPGIHNFSDYDHWNYKWQEEYSIILSSEFKKLLKKYNINLISYKEL